MEHRPRTVAIATAQTLALVAFAGLMAAFVVQLVTSLRAPAHVLVVLAVALPAYLLTDALSGVVHWFLDRFLSEDAPVIGRWLVYPFREHHRDPLAMTRHGFVELNGNNAVPLVPVLAAAVWLGPRWGDGLGATALRGSVAVFALAIFATNQFHYWAHAPRRPRLVAWLQARGLILAPAHHAAHHVPPFAGSYCITAGWMNHLFDRFRLLERCERVLVAAGVPRAPAGAGGRTRASACNPPDPRPMSGLGDRHREP